MSQLGHPSFKTKPSRQTAAVDGDQLAELLQATAKGDRRLFRELYDQTSRFTFGIILAVLRRRDWAEEIAQEVYVSIWSSAGEFNPAQGDPLAWIARLARNRAIDRLRKERGRGQAAISLLPLHELEIAAADKISPEGIAVRKALSDIKGDYRQALLLAYFQGCSHREIAEHLDIPLGTAKSRVRRGLAQLKEALA